MRNTTELSITELEALFNSCLTTWRQDKKEMGSFAKFDSLAPDFLDEIVIELATRLHPVASRDKSEVESQRYTIQVTAENHDGGAIEKQTYFMGTLAQARIQANREVNLAYSSEQYSGVSVDCWNETGHSV